MPVCVSKSKNFSDSCDAVQYKDVTPFFCKPRATFFPQAKQLREVTRRYCVLGNLLAAMLCVHGTVKKQTVGEHAGKVWQMSHRQGPRSPRPPPQELPLPELYGMDPVGAQRDAVGVSSFAETAVERIAA